MRKPDEDSRSVLSQTFDVRPFYGSCDIDGRVRVAIMENLQFPMLLRFIVVRLSNDVAAFIDNPILAMRVVLIGNNARRVIFILWEPVYYAHQGPLPSQGRD